MSCGLSAEKFSANPDVPYDALLRVLCRYLDILCRYLDKTVEHPANHHGVVEEKSARVVGVDQSCLNAGLGKNGHLRLDRNMESVERRA